MKTNYNELYEKWGYSFIKPSDQKAKVVVKCNNCDTHYELNKYSFKKRKTKYCQTCIKRLNSKPENKIGQKFKNLTIIEYQGTDNHDKHVYKFKCDCGNTKVARLNNVVYGKTSSCGCKKAEYIKRNNRKDMKEVTVNKVFAGLSTKRRPMEVTITKEDVKNLLFQPCHYCGMEGSNITKASRCKDKRFIKHNGIDRIDSTKGYIKGNVVTCCKYCNQMKMDLSVDEFKEHITLLYKNFVEEK